MDFGRGFQCNLKSGGKRGGNAQLDCSTSLIRDYIELLRVLDVTLADGIFTWNNMICGEEEIVERLNIFLVSFYWISDKKIINSEI